MTQQEPPKINWRTRSYIIWTSLGTVMGVFAAYFYTRAATEYANRHNGDLPRMQTGELLGLALALLAMVRQIAELGKPDKPNK